MNNIERNKPMDTCILANPGICICRTISLILQDFACFYRTTLHSSAPTTEFRHPEVNYESNIYHMHVTLYLLSIEDYYKVLSIINQQECNMHCSTNNYSANMLLLLPERCNIISQCLLW